MFVSTRPTTRLALASALIALIALLALLALLAVPAGAQTYRTALGVTGGWSTADDLTPGLSVNTTFESGWTAGGQVETWRGRYGLRLNGTYAAREVEDTDRSFRIAAADLALMVRFLPPAWDRPIAPFVALGIGPVVYMAEDDANPLGDGQYGSDPVIRLMLAPAVGVDLFTASAVGLRLELTDQIVFPSIGESPATDGTPRTHNPGVRAALQVRLGRPAPPPVVTRTLGPPEATDPATPTPDPTRAPDPTPAPEPTRAPEPTPAPEPAQPPEPAPTEPATSPMAEATLGDAGRVYTVQVGSYAQEGMARAEASRLEASRIPVWFAQAVVGGQRVIRLRVGAVDALDDAELLAQRLQHDFGYAPWIDTVGPDEPVPTDAIVATLRYLFR